MRDIRTSTDASRLNKRWWRNFIERRPVDVRRAGRLRAGTCRAVAANDPEYNAAWQAYQRRQHVSRMPGDRLLFIDFVEPTAPSGG